jgi:hypothetical protein
MKKGDKVYRVCPMFEIPGMHYHVQSRTLVVVSTKQLRLDSHFDGGENLIYRPNDLGCIFFLTAAEAVDAHERRALRSVEGAKIALRNAEVVAARAVAWSARWREENS